MLAAGRRRRQDTCQTSRTRLDVLNMNDKIIYARVPGELQGALERERQRMCKAAGAEVKTSAAIRALLEKALRKKKTASSRERAA